MKDIMVVNLADVKATHKNEHQAYEYYKKPLVPAREGHQCCIAAYEIPPGKCAYPYHYHTMNEEAFYILSGTGMLTTPQGDRAVSQGDFLFFPTGEQGAHLLRNTSDTERLVYLDFDTLNPIDVSFYPQTGKIGIWGRNTNRVFRISDEVDYYEGETQQ